jgi:hypothetical protein
MLNSEHASAGKFCNVGQQRGAVQFFCRAISITKRIIEANGIELGIGFLDQPLDIVLVVPTMIIPPIREYEQGTFSVVCTPHLTESQVDSVQEGSPALWSSQHHPALKIFNAVSKGTGQFGPLIKADQEEFILRVGSLEEFESSLPGLVDFVGHAAAEIENHADRYGNILGGERDYFLLGIVFKDAEIVLVEARDQPIERVGYGYIYQS